MAEAASGQEVMAPATAVDLPAPVFHAETDALRFWVAIPGSAVTGASVSRSVLHYRFQALLDGSDALVIYAANRVALDSAVLRRVAAGSREPVMLREHDLPRPTQG
jgi:hypothetical protein